MPVQVFLPIRIKTDPGALEERQYDVQEALSAAAGRALTNSRNVVLERRGGYVGVKLHAPEVTWSGDGLADVPASVRAEIEQMLSSMLPRAARAAGIGELMRVPGTAAARLLPGALGASALGVVSEPADPERLGVDGQTYLVPTYQGAGKPLPLPVKKPGRPAEVGEGTATPSTSLAILDDLETVEGYIRQFYRDPSPRGNSFYGVYGIWAEDMIPRVFWISGQIQEGALQGRSFVNSVPLVVCTVEGGHVETAGDGRVPVALKLGGRYRLEGLMEARRFQGVPYSIVLRDEAGGSELPTFFTDSDRQMIRGKTIHFGVAAEPVYETVIRAPREAAARPKPGPVGVPSWAFVYRDSALPLEPEGDIPERIWWWYGWFNVRPAEMRANPLVRAVFTEWEQNGRRRLFNPLFIHIHLGEFYQAFCQKLALKLLAESRQNMREFLASLNSDSRKWEERFSALLAWLQEPAQALDDVRKLPELRERLRARERDYQDQMREGSLPGGVVTLEEVEALRQRVAAAEAAAGTDEERKLASLMQMAQELEPLLVLLTIHEGETVSSLEEAILAFYDNFGTPGTAPRAMAYLRQQLSWLIEKTLEAERKIAGDVDIAYKLRFVQERANTELAPWFQADPFFRQQVEKLTSGPGLLFWIGLGITLLVLTFIFPPMGALLSAGLGVGIAYGSVRDALISYRLSKVRIAQAGFAPLVSEEEVAMAIFQAVVDVSFALLDIGALSMSVGKLARPAAREAAGALGRSMETVVVGMRQLDRWPPELVQLIRGRIVEEMERRSLVIAEDAVDRLVASAQREMIARYQLRLLRLQEDFAQLLQSRRVSAKEAEQWLLREFPRPGEFLEDLAHRELSPGKDLFEKGVVARLGDAVPPPPLAPFQFLGEMTQAEMEALSRELGPMAQLLTPNRLRPLGLSTQISYSNLARRLRGLLVRTKDPEEALALIEKLLIERQDSRAVFEAMEGLANPRPVLGALTPRLLDVPMPGRYHELFDAISRAPRQGEGVRFIVDLDAQRVPRLFHELAGPEGRPVFRRWEGPKLGWVEDPSVRVAKPRAERAVAEVSAEEEAKALKGLQEASQVRRPSGPLTSGARRLRDLLQKMGSHPALQEIARVSAREGQGVATRIMDGLAYLLESGPVGSTLDGVTIFLRRGGEGRALAEILDLGAEHAGRYKRVYIRNLLEKMPNFRENDLKGIAVAMEQAGGGRRGAETMLYIDGNFKESWTVFGALYDVAPHSDGIPKVLRYLSSVSQNNNQAALGQLFAARKLLEEFPGQRLVFEAAVEVDGKLIREIDVRVVTQYTRVTLLDVEIKEIKSLMPLAKEHIRQQFARDIVASVKAAGPGEAPLGRVRWLIREKELLESGISREDLLKEIRQLLSESFLRYEMRSLTRAEYQAALQDFRARFEQIVRLY